jgi:DNA-binding transcriptional MerR regulator
VIVRTLHYYDQIGLLRPASYGANGYRQYGEDAVVPLQQIMFFRELGFSLDDIKDIMSRPDFDVLEALRSHRTLLMKKGQRINELLATVDRTIGQLQGETKMEIKDYYEGFSDEKIDEYRKEVRERWGEDTLRDSEARVMNMGKKRFAELQAEGGAIFQAIADNMPQGFDSSEVQAQVAKWRQWLEHFHTYSDEAVLGLGRTYSQDPRFGAFFEKYGKDFPAFLTKAIENYCVSKT